MVMMRSNKLAGYGGGTNVNVKRYESDDMSTSKKEVLR